MKDYQFWVSAYFFIGWAATTPLGYNFHWKTAGQRALNIVLWPIMALIFWTDVQ